MRLLVNLKINEFQFAMSSKNCIIPPQLNRKKSTVIQFSVNYRVHRALVTFTSAKTFPLSIW